jgi:hypothetical protein
MAELRRSVALLTLAPLALAACSSTGSRIRSEQELFDSYPPEVQQNIRDGVIEGGYTREMVRMALGKPDRISETQAEGGPVEVWTYRRSSGPGFSVGVGVGTGTFSRSGSGVGVGTGVSLDQPPRGEDIAVVEFEQGVVTRFHADTPR